MAILVQSNKKPSVSFPSQTGSIITFNSQYAGLPLKSHKIAVSSQSGVSAINIYHPDNLIDFSTCIQGYLYVDGGLVRPTTAMEWTTDYITVNPNSSIVWWADIVASNRQWVAFSYYDSNGDFIVRHSWYRDTQIYTQTDTVPNNTTSVRVSWRNYSNDDFTNRYFFTEKQGLKTISIGQTVNEGEYNARTGVLEVTQPSVQTLQLPPCPMNTFEGVNNIWADTGETTVEYIKIGG